MIQFYLKVKLKIQQLSFWHCPLDDLNPAILLQLAAYYSPNEVMMPTDSSTKAQ